jgi:hypothetical protein
VGKFAAGQPPLALGRPRALRCEVAFGQSWATGKRSPQTKSFAEGKHKACTMQYEAQYGPWLLLPEGLKTVPVESHVDPKVQGEIWIERNSIVDGAFQGTYVCRIVEMEKGWIPGMVLSCFANFTGRRNCYRASSLCTCAGSQVRLAPSTRMASRSYTR